MSHVDPLRDVSEIRVKKHFSRDHEIFVVWLSGQRFERRKKRSGLRPALCSLPDLDDGDRTISPGTQTRLAQTKVVSENDQGEPHH
jgi:hypothetical protein